MSKKLDVAKSYWAAEKARDLDLILSHFAEDAAFRSPTMTLQGRTDIAEYYKGVLSSFGDVDVSILRSVEQGDLLVVEWLCRLMGTDGKAREVLGCNVFTIPDAIIASLNVYFNAPDFD